MPEYVYEDEIYKMMLDNWETWYTHSSGNAFMLWDTTPYWEQ